VASRDDRGGAPRHVPVPAEEHREGASVRVAGQTISDPLAAFVAYLEEHSGTVKHYDFIAGTSDQVTAALIKATRMPWMASRITASEEAWFTERARCAPWDLVPPWALLRDADAVQRGGLYDMASALWGHFWVGRPTGIAAANISKVLYLMRPAFFPILDSRLMSLYSLTAKAAARDVTSRRPELAAYKRMTWEAIRRDLVSNEAALREVRGALQSADHHLASEASVKFSDVRLLDILAWRSPPR
jgi:Family of unknown function (DUF6308)